MYFYSDDGSGTGIKGSCLSKIDPTRAFLKHYDNFLFLSFIAERGELLERYQAEKELKICQRKMDYWSKRPGYNHEEALSGCEALKANWNV